MQKKVTQLEIVRFLARTGGYISCPAILGREAKVYGASYVKAAAHSIPDAMLKALISKKLVEVSENLMDEKRYTLGRKRDNPNQSKRAMLTASVRRFRRVEQNPRKTSNN